MSSDAAMEAKSAPSSAQNAPAKKPNWFVRILSAFFISLFISVVLEWVGMVFFWPELGAQHSAIMLETEFGYLNRDFSEGLLFDPSSAIRNSVSFMYYWAFEWTHIERAVVYIGSVLNVDVYVAAAFNTSLLVFTRVVILTFSLPCYVLFGLVGAMAGFSMRDIRRWSGGREYGRIYHQAKAWAPRILVAVWVVYLTLPVSVHPNAIILPAALLFGVNEMIIRATFKKYW